MTIPTIAFLLPAGILSDRLDRRTLMLSADLARALVIGALAVLSVTGLLTFWELAGRRRALRRRHRVLHPRLRGNRAGHRSGTDLAAATRSTSSSGRSRSVSPGPALGGALVAGRGTGAAFGVDAASFLASAVAIFLMRPPAHPRSEHVQSSIGALREAFVFVRRRVWLWGTLLSATIAYLAFMGPAEVLLPYLVKNELHASAGDLGLVFAAGGVGAIGAALFMGQRGHPRRDVTFMYATWTLATLAIAGYGLATRPGS